MKTKKKDYVKNKTNMKGELFMDNKKIIERECYKCGKTYPETRDYFHRDPSGRGGYNINCKDCENEKHKECYRTNSEYKERKKRESEERRKAKRGLLKCYNKEDELFSLNFFNNCCAICGRSSEWQYENYGHLLEFDHVIPISQNGATISSNLVPCCTLCNRGRQNTSLLFWIEEMKELEPDMFTIENQQRILEYTIICLNRYILGER